MSYNVVKKIGIICHPRLQWLGNTKARGGVVRAGQIIRVRVLGFHGCCVLACAEEGREGKKEQQQRTLLTLFILS
jgi:hypothetical protein